MSSTKKNIAIIVSNLEYGGAQRQIVELVNNINDELYNVHIISLSDYVPLSSQLERSIPVHIALKKSKFDFTVVFKLLSLIRQYKFEILHSYLFDAEIAARLAGFLSAQHPRVIGAERNTDYEFKKVQLLAYRATNRMFDLVIANSQTGAAFNAAALGIESEKYRVIYNGVDVTKFSPGDKGEMRKRLGISPEIPLVGIFASFKEQKNHPFLLDALLKIIDQYPNIKLLMVGDMLYGGMHGSDDYFDNIIDTINNSKLKDVCIQLGNRDDIEFLYPACDFTVLPSLYEGTPNVILESMACGVPVIATLVSDNDRIIESEKSGLLVSLNNLDELTLALKRMLDSPNETRIMGENARRRVVQNFSTKMLAKNTCAVYEELLHP